MSIDCANCFTCQVCYSCEGTCETCQSCYKPERGQGAQCVNCFTCQVCYSCEGACETCQLGYAGGEESVQRTQQVSIEERLSRLERMVMELYSIVSRFTSDVSDRTQMNMSPAGCDEYEVVPKGRPQRKRQIDLR